MSTYVIEMMIDVTRLDGGETIRLADDLSGQLGRSRVHATILPGRSVTIRETGVRGERLADRTGLFLRDFTAAVGRYEGRIVLTHLITAPQSKA